MKLLVKRMCCPMWNLVPDLGIESGCIGGTPCESSRRLAGNTGLLSRDRRYVFCRDRMPDMIRLDEEKDELVGSDEGTSEKKGEQRANASAEFHTRHVVTAEVRRAHSSAEQRA